LEEAGHELTEEELDAFLGGEIAFFALPSAVERLSEQLQALNEQLSAMAPTAAAATPTRGRGPHGISCRRLR
jgi:hypothetical protein